ncbi:MAG TPA: glycosyltransferase family 4 protein [Rhodocyclaceae bacterium]|nr:glycosyltransferase family 4 protein [Rhodocyclaceae bacterium]
MHTESSCGWGGQEIRILTEAEGMMARGHQVTLVCPPQARIHAAAEARGIPLAGLTIARKNLAGFRALRRWLATHGQAVDIVNTHSSTDAWLTALACASLRGAPPMVRTRHVSSPVKRNRPTLWLYQRATRHVVTTGEALRTQLARDNGFDPASMTSVPTGIDLNRFVPGDRRAARARLGLPERPTIGILGTLRNWKGHTYLFEAFASLQASHPDWQLIVIGDGPQRRNLERLARELGLGARLRMAGNRDDVPDWLQALDLMALPSYGEEGVPQSVMQGMACGLPVVSTPVGAIAEAVDDGETGLLVPPRDAAALAAALALLMDDAPLRERFGRQGLARARERFGIDIMLERMEAIFLRHARPGGSA